MTICRWKPYSFPRIAATPFAFRRSQDVRSSAVSVSQLNWVFCVRLTAGEIVEQIIIALNDAYGIGVKAAARNEPGRHGSRRAFSRIRFADEGFANHGRTATGLHIVPNRVTVSTAGVVPRIRELATIPDRPHLAVSLGAPTDELRNVLMPINKKWPLNELLDACKDFEQSLKRGERFTFEYVMLDGVNDSDEHARQLANLLNRHELRVKVNLIPHNPADPLPYRPSSPERVEDFRAHSGIEGNPCFRATTARARHIRGLRPTGRASRDKSAQAGLAPIGLKAAFSSGSLEDGS